MVIFHSLFVRLPGRVEKNCQDTHVWLRWSLWEPSSHTVEAIVLRGLGEKMASLATQLGNTAAGLERD